MISKILGAAVGRDGRMQREQTHGAWAAKQGSRARRCKDVGAENGRQNDHADAGKLDVAHAERDEIGGSPQSESANGGRRSTRLPLRRIAAHRHRTR